MSDQYCSQVLHFLQLIEVQGTVRIRRPVCPDIDTMFGCLFDVEEHSASDDTEKSRTAESGHRADYTRVGSFC